MDLNARTLILLQADKCENLKWEVLFLVENLSRENPKFTLKPRPLSSEFSS